MCLHVVNLYIITACVIQYVCLCLCVWQEQSHILSVVPDGNPVVAVSNAMGGGPIPIGCPPHGARRHSGQQALWMGMRDW